MTRSPHNIYSSRFESIIKCFKYLDIRWQIIRVSGTLYKGCANIDTAQLEVGISVSHSQPYIGSPLLTSENRAAAVKSVGTSFAIALQVVP